MDVRRLVVTFDKDGITTRALYRRKDGPGPSTKARRREVAALARDGLERALEALDGRVDVVGTAGFTTREDVLLTTTSPTTESRVKGAR
jgi:hypothetical protein